MKLREHLESTRFFYIQEGVAVGLISAFSKAFLPGYPIVELFAFIGPILAFAFGFKTWGDIKENQVRLSNGAKPK